MTTMTQVLVIFVSILSTATLSVACNLEGKNMQYNQVGLNDSDSNYYNQVRKTSSIEVPVPGQQRHKK